MNARSARAIYIYIYLFRFLHIYVYIYINMGAGRLGFGACYLVNCRSVCPLQLGIRHKQCLPSPAPWVGHGQQGGFGHVVLISGPN